MFKLLFFVILLFNLDLAYGPLSIKPGKISTWNPIKSTGFSHLRKMFKSKNSTTPPDVISVNSPASTVEMPKQDLTKKSLSRSVKYRPLVIEVTKFGNWFPLGEIDNHLEPSKIVSKTSFPKIEFFCPTESSDTDSCMLQTNYRKCTSNPKPLIERMMVPVRKKYETSSQLANSADVSQGNDDYYADGNEKKPLEYHARCGPVGQGRMYTYSYELCFNKNSSNKDDNDQNTKLKVEQYEIYNFCYDHKKKETIYTQHEIKWPKLLFNEELKQEQEMSFEMSTEDYNDYFKGFFKTADDAYTKSQNANKPQKLVPPEDFAYALWKIPTFHYVNVRPQHQDLMELWNLIGKLIRNGSAAKANISHFIYTGTFRITKNDLNEIEYIRDDDIEIPEFWIKIVLIEDFTEKIRGLAILMRNNIEPDSKIRWDTYCEQNYCFIPNREDELFKRLTDVGRNVRCCRINKSILTLFNLDREYEVEEIEPLLIDGLIDSVFIIPPQS